MKRQLSPSLLAGTAVALAACATVFGFGPPRDSIRVPHQRHKEADLECVACHETIFDAEDLSNQDLPKEKKCYECHKDQKANKDCKFCHTMPEAPQPIAKKERHLVFSHAKHLAMKEVNEDCGTCHKRLPDLGYQGPVSPPMDACLACHEHQQHFDDGACETCHQDLTEFPLKPLSTFSHKGDFLHTHPQLARSKPSNCATCHQQEFCSECHASTVAHPIEVAFPEKWNRQMIHRGDWVGRHMIEARADEAMCQRCHTTKFCNTCHIERQVSFGAERPYTPHGPGVNDKTAADFHGKQARRDIVACASCHDQGAASNCVTCHRVGGAGGNPHPTSWLARHHTEEISTNAMCLTCHR